MPGPAFNVVHVLAADVPQFQAGMLRTLLSSVPDARQSLIHAGPGAPPLATARLVHRVHAPLPIPDLQRALLRRALVRCGAWGRRPLVLHAWSASAAKWCLSLKGAPLTMLIELECDDPPSPVQTRLPGGLWSLPLGAEIPTCRYICRHPAAQHRLRSVGLPADRCVLIPPIADPPARGGHTLPRPLLATASLRPQREGGLSVLIVPPTCRASGAFMAAWGGLLVEKVRPEVWVLVLGDGREKERIAHLARTSGHEHVLRFVSGPEAWPAALADADLAVYVPSHEGPVTGLAATMAAGVPLVASDVPFVRQWLAAGEDAWLCRPDDPEDAARVLLSAIEDRETSVRFARQAAIKARTLFSLAEGLRLYRQAYGLPAETQ